MEVFLARIRQLLPVLGSDILAPITQPPARPQPGGVLFCRIKGAESRGQRTASGFVVFQGSKAVFEQRKSADTYPYVVAQRRQLIDNGTLVEKQGFLEFTKDTEFSSPSAAAAAIHGGSANGLIAWKTATGRSSKTSTSTVDRSQQLLHMIPEPCVNPRNSQHDRSKRDERQDSWERIQIPQIV